MRLRAHVFLSYFWLSALLTLVAMTPFSVKAQAALTRMVGGQIGVAPRFWMAAWAVFFVAVVWDDIRRGGWR